MTVTVTSFDGALKQLYSDRNVANTTLKRRPMFGAIPKAEGFGGRNMPVINWHGDGQGRSASFTKAKANQSSVAIEDFLLTRVSNYSLASITGEAAEASKGDKVAFLAGLKSAIDGAMNVLANNIETQICRSGTGSIAVVGTLATTSPWTSLTLADSADVVNFEVNQKIVLSATDGGAVRTATTLTIAKINRSSGLLTFVDTKGAGATSSDNTLYNASPLFANGDFISTEGDLNQGISGFEAWVPATPPSDGESFFSVDRSTDSRMYGQYHDGSGGAIRDALIDGASISARVSGAPDVCFVNHVQMRNLISALQGDKQYSSVNAVTHKGQVADIGYRSVAVQGDNGVINVVAANKCQPQIAWMLEMKSWTLHTLGAPTKFLMLDENRILRNSDADSYQVRLGFRGNIACTRPMHNVHIKMPAV